MGHIVLKNVLVFIMVDYAKLNVRIKLGQIVMNAEYVLKIVLFVMVT